MKNQTKGFTRLLYATRFSLQGFIAAWKNEAAFRQEIILLIVLSFISLFLPITHLERLAMIASLILIVIVELLNTAIEVAIDRIGAEHHELSGRSKDIASAAVFTSLFLAAFTWGYILIF